MAMRDKGRSKITVEGREFVYHVHDEVEVRVASSDKKFVVSYRWVGEPVVKVSGQEFPGLPTDRPVMLRPPRFDYRSPSGLARQLIRWALYEERDLERAGA